MKSIQTRQRIVSALEKMVNHDQNIHDAHLLVHSESHPLHVNLAMGNKKFDQSDLAYIGQPVYMASVGKLFTAVLIAVLCERRVLSYQQRIVDVLPQELLDGLHVYRRKDFSDCIQIRHLLNHTSGLPDYFEDQPRKGLRMVERLILEPECNYRPEKVVAWSKENLQPKFPPGKGFYYSDTGYHLLGLVIESVTGKPFHEALSHWILEPLGMCQTFLIGHSLPAEKNPYPVAGVYFSNINIADYPSLSMDYAGGGITAPLEDLLLFMQALVQGKLLSQQTFLEMNDCVSFAPGIDYGYGMMKIRSFPLLMPAKYTCWGNAGSIGSFMFYHPELDTILIGSLNQFRYHRKGIQFMHRIIDVLYGEKT